MSRYEVFYIHMKTHKKTISTTYFEYGGTQHMEPCQLIVEYRQKADAGRTYRYARSKGSLAMYICGGATHYIHTGLI